MRNKIKILLGCCLALLLLDSGTAYGQTGLINGWAWGNGNCDTNQSIIGTGTYEASSSVTDHFGLKIAGTRTSSWNSWTNTTTYPFSTSESLASSTSWINSGTCTCNPGGGAPITYPPSTRTRYNRYIRWTSGVGWEYIDYYETETNTDCCNESWGNSSSVAVGVWEPLTGINFPDDDFVGHHVDHDHTNHFNHVRISVSGGSICVPNHYDNFEWRDAIWYHQRNNYFFDLGTPGGGAPNIDDEGTNRYTNDNYTTTGLYNNPFGSSSGSTTTVYAESGTIRINASNTSVRLHNPMASSWSLTVGYLDFNSTLNNSFRFDAPFSGTPTSPLVTHQGADDNTNGTGPWLVIGSGKTLSGIGFWDGTSMTGGHEIQNGGTLWLGETTSGQNNIILNAPNASDRIIVENYLCCGDDDDNGIDHGHGVWFNVGNITNNTRGSGVIEIRNDQSCATSCGSLLSWLNLDANSALPDLYNGNANIWAYGNITFLNAVSTPTAPPTAAGTHNIYSINGYIHWPYDYSITSDDDNIFENYYTLGTCCDSYILAEGTQSYNFSGANGSLDMSTEQGSIQMDQTFDFIGSGSNNNLNMLGKGGIKIDGAVTVNTNDNGHARFYSQNSSINFGSTLEQIQSGTPTGNWGLTLWANGLCDALICLPGGFVQVDGSISLTNVGIGVDTIHSAHDQVHLNEGIAYTGVDGKLWIDGYKSVNISGEHNGMTPPLPAGISLDASGAGNEGVYILRTGTGNDTIHSGKGHVYVEKPFTYWQTPTTSSSGLSILAEGLCYDVDCDAAPTNPVGGWVGIYGALTTANNAGTGVGDGYSRIVSTDHFVEIDQGYVHQGVDGDMTVKGYSYVDIKNPYPSDQVTIGGNPEIMLPKYNFSAIEGVYINRMGDGRDSIWSNSGHVMVTDPFSYEQGSTSQTNTNGLVIFAQGPCDFIDCNQGVSALQSMGYVWMKNDVWTKNDAIGHTRIETDRHFVRIGEKSASDSYDGGHLTHEGQSGELSIVAGLGVLGPCPVICDVVEDTLSYVQITTATAGRSYVWIGDDVFIKKNSTDPLILEGNAVIRSHGDIIQMNDSVTFADTNGANFWVDGLWGIRTLGPTSLTNNDFSNIGGGTSTRINPLYATTNQQGFVTYLSQSGYVDFGVGPVQVSDINAYNTPFKYVGDTTQNALLIEGNRRVFFGDSVTIVMDVKQSLDPSPNEAGNAKIFSPIGWISHLDTVEFTGFNGNFITYAEGPNVSRRSCWVPYDICAVGGGFVLYDSIFKINYVGQGVTWIRSTYDDVVFGDTVTYQNPTFNTAFGEIVIQAGQDIYGRNYDQGFVDAITIDQKGDKSILFEAKNTIHLEQNLFVSRSGNATEGDITFKAGYPTFSSRTFPTGYTSGETVISQSANRKDTPPTADMDYLTWNVKGDCPFLYNYVERFPCDIFDMRPFPDGASDKGGDIWLEAHTLFDLTNSAPTNNKIQTTLRAHKSIFIDSSFVYQTNVEEGGDVLLFAETGNIEAAVTRQDRTDFRTNGYIADDYMLFDIDNPNFNAEIRLQAGNLLWIEGDINTQPVNFPNCWTVGCNPGAEFNGNILFNKPFFMINKGTGKTLLSAARDIETQVMAPTFFDFTNSGHTNTDSLTLTAGRHIETHAMMQFDYDEPNTLANITLQAGRLNQTDLTRDTMLCKAIEEGTTLTDASLLHAFDPEVNTGGVGGANGVKNNEFAEGGKGQGSILVFDSLLFNYNGSGKILLEALNGNIESDPYLHRTPEEPGNPGLFGLTGNWGDGYFPHINWSPTANPSSTAIQHDAQITFNHGGAGVTQLKAIDIKLHDKIAYYTNQHLVNNRNGQFYMTAFDSILTRNIEYVNMTDTGSVFITSAKYKETAADCASSYCNPLGNICGLDNLPIYQGHIVLGYGADRDTLDDAQNMNDSIVFNFAGNMNTQGANVYILAGYEGYYENMDKGIKKANLFTTPDDVGKGYGGNITFDFMKLDMARGNHTTGGFLEISTPNGNIWGKDSIVYRGFDGDIKVDAGLGSKDDADAIRWEGANDCAGGAEKTLNTLVPFTCDTAGEWRTGNIMMKGASLNFADGEGHATFRTREGFIDMYDAVTVDSMRGHLLVYAGTNSTKQLTNQWGDVSERDFEYNPILNSGSVFFGADDNIMLNYGYSNDNHAVADGYLYKGRGQYDILPKSGIFTALAEDMNPYYWTTYKPDGVGASRAIFNVNEDGYLWYMNRNAQWPRKLHRLYRGCEDSNGSADCSGFAGLCKTTDNFARPLMFNFDTDANTNAIESGGLGIVATNYIDMFTKFTFFGGGGSGMASVPGMTTLRGESVAGYGLYMKSVFDGQKVEKRRNTCEGCGELNRGYPVGEVTDKDLSTYEWTYIGFHDDARIHTNSQKSLIEAPIVEFFGHAELDAYHDSGSRTRLTVKSDSLIFHDSAVFSGRLVELLPFTTDERREIDLRYGVVNDMGASAKFYGEYGKAISMPNRNMPVLEFGYQRCNEPLLTPHLAPNLRSESRLEPTPRVGGDVIVAFKYDFSLPILNTVVANHARISFMDDLDDGVGGGEFIDACVRTDLLRIRNKVEFYSDPIQTTRRGTLRLTSNEQMPSAYEAGIFPHHLHLEPGSELSLPGEGGLEVISTTTLGGYGELHENVRILADGIIAPGYASLMEHDCQTGYPQGKLAIHNLYMEKDAIMRISISYNRLNCRFNPDTNENDLYCTQTDTLLVQDSIFFFGKIPLWIMPESEYIEPGCYLFLIYNDLAASVEYVNNLVLMNPRHGDYYFALDKSEPGRVYLCVTTTPTPILQRYIHIHAVDGVTTDPVAEIYHYVGGHDDFVFKATYDNKIPLEVLATGYYSQKTTKLPSTYLFDGTYQYMIRQVVEPHDVYFGDVDTNAGGVGNEGLIGQRVWSYRNTLYVNVDKDDIVSIYNVTGVLFRKLEIPAGLSKSTLERGVYIVTLKDGSVYKIIIN